MKNIQIIDYDAVRTNLGFPLHADGADENHYQNSYDSDQPDVLDASVDNLEIVTLEQIV